MHHISTNHFMFLYVCGLLKKKCTLLRVQKKKTIVLSLNREPFVLFSIKSEESYSSMSPHVIYIDLYGLYLSPSSYQYAWGISAQSQPCHFYKDIQVYISNSQPRPSSIIFKGPITSFSFFLHCIPQKYMHQNTCFI